MPKIKTPKLSDLLDIDRQINRFERSQEVWHHPRAYGVLEVDEDYEARYNARNECTCCSCYFHIGPPGCDGSNCHDCGGRC